MAEQLQTSTTSPHPLLLEQLRDLHLPEAPPWWSIAPGWWWLIAISAALLIYLCVRAIRHWRRTPRESCLVSHLNQAYRHWHAHRSTSSYLQDIGLTLRAYALDREGRESVAKLSGTEWIQWLEKHQHTSLSDAASQALSQHCYQRNPTTDINALHQELKRWAQSRAPDQKANQHA